MQYTLAPTIKSTCSIKRLRYVSATGYNGCEPSANMMPGVAGPKAPAALLTSFASDLAIDCVHHRWSEGSR